MDSRIEALLELVARLRDPREGCPWDLAQDMKSLTRYTVEEMYEVVDCIERDDHEALPGELGDLLFQIVFYAQIAAEDGRFNFGDIVRRIVEKLTRRHPHVFGDEPRLDAAAQAERWERLKSAERKGRPDSLVADLPLAMPALMRAAKLQGRAARVGFDWPDVTPVFSKIEEELDELKAALGEGSATAVAAELGDVLFTCVNLARHLGVEPETALREANHRFESRFRHMEAATTASGRLLGDCAPSEQETLWQAAKQALE